MQSSLVAPRDLFRRMHKMLTENPSMLSQHHYHEMSNGTEALTPDQILATTAKHCIAGLIVALTPNAAKFERLREDVDTYANEILVNSRRKPLPMAIIHGDEESARRIIARRAEQEEMDEARMAQYLEVFN